MDTKKGNWEEALCQRVLETIISAGGFISVERLAQLFAVNRPTIEWVISLLEQKRLVGRQGDFVHVAEDDTVWESLEDDKGEH